MEEPYLTPELSASVSRRVAAGRHDFASRWNCQSRPRIEEFLGGLKEPDRSMLLRELLQIEWENLLLSGETPAIEEYQQRFPGHHDLIAEVSNQSRTVIGTLKNSTDSQGVAKAAPATSPSPLPVVPGYEIHGILGRGGMGVVFLARDQQLKRMVALKMIRTGNHADFAELQRFRIEGEAVARLQHPNIVQIYAIGEHEGQPYLVLEYVDGNSLDKQYRGTPVDQREAARLVNALAQAIQEAHNQGIIHRDLKPSNVLLAASGQPKVSDFGLAKRLDEASGQTQAGDVMGTPSYMAPEQARGLVKGIGPATDIYALGAILYELLTGRPPFRAATPLDTLRQVMDSEPAPPRRLNPAVSRDLETVCLKCLQKSPSQRYQTAGDLADDLRRWMKGEAITARPSGVLERACRWCRRNPSMAFTSFALLLAGSIGSLLWITRPAYLDLRVKPAESQVTIDGKAVPVVDGKLLFTSVGGRHQIEAHAPGYAPASQSVVLVRGRDNTAAVSLELEVLEGRLELNSSPSGADVNVIGSDGQVKTHGTTPFYSPPLPSGDYRVTVSLALYAPQTLNATVPSGRRVTTLETLTLAPAFEGSESYHVFRKRRERLRQPLLKSWNFNDLPLDRALQLIEENEGISIFLDQAALQAEGIRPDTSVSRSFQGITLQASLNLLLSPLSLTYVPWDHDVVRLKITTLTSANRQMETVIFPVGDLLAATPQSKQISIGLLMQQVMEKSGPWQLHQGRGGLMSPMSREQALSVQASWQTLVQVDETLRELRTARISAGQTSP